MACFGGGAGASSLDGFGNCGSAGASFPGRFFVSSTFLAASLVLAYRAGAC